jgi:hypothetical protein
MNMDIINIINDEISILISESWYDEESQFDDYEPRLSDRITSRLGIDITSDGKPKQQSDMRPNNMGDLEGKITHRFYEKLPIPISLYKNPRSLEGFSKDARGILFSNGDFLLR